MKTKNLLLSVLVIAVMAAPSGAASHSPTPTNNYWLSLINTTHIDPTDMVVIVVPPAYGSSIMVADTTWITGLDPLYDHPAVQATLEAIEYWAWHLNQQASTWGQLNHVTWDAKVLGVDATPADIAGADIVVFTAMLSKPAPFLFHLGLGLPTYPPYGAVLGPLGAYWQDTCTVWNTGVGSPSGDTDPLRLRNLVIHEFGHCVGAGHTGTSLGAAHCDSHNVCYTSHPTDVMSNVVGNTRQCLSNLNAQSIAEGYHWLPGTWQTHSGETYMHRGTYTTHCMPSGMQRF